MKKITARFLVLITLCIGLLGISSTDISARPPGPICQPFCSSFGVVCEQTYDLGTQRCVPTTACSYTFGCIIFDTLEESDTTGEENILFP
jgi:hypothetical protein